MLAAVVLAGACGDLGGGETTLAGALSGAGIDASALEPWTERGGRTFYRMEVSGSSAVAVWRLARTAAPQAGYWPLIVSGPDAAEGLTDWETQDDRTVPEVLADAGEVDVKAWMADRALAAPKVFEVPRGRWEATWDPPDHPQALLDVSTRALRGQAWLTFVPAARPEDVPAVLGYGGWNDCPPAHVHVAFLRRWNEAWGAVPIAASRDTLELHADRLPRSRTAAFHLANELFVYCPDAVHQGVGTVDSLGAGLMHARFWSLWWD